ncbi:MAG: hypothetical protein KBD53_11485 [Candidatus Omnitrophica bacterium]|nr:hypothetical protein [Candidatus Omnitrophota bacterium]
MGVIHKLRQEVIDFIIDQKMDHPALGCRALAEVTSEKFSINVSKSSVNSVIKNSQLSSSVGRPHRKIEEKIKKFHIPSEKRQQIVKELHKIPLPTHTTPEIPIEINLSNQDLVDNAFEFRKNDSTEDEKPEPKEISNDLSVAPASSKIQKYAGLVFLQAAIWENLEEGFLGNLMSTFNTGYDKSLFDKRCNAAFIYSSLNIQEQDDDVDSILSLTNNLESFDDHIFLNQEIPAHNRIALLSKTELELEQLLNFVGGFSINLANTKTVELSSSLTEIIEMNHVKTWLPLKSSLDKLSNTIISNRYPLVLTKPLSDDVISNSLINLICAFECVNGYEMDKISLTGEHGNVLADFSSIPRFPRKLAFGIYPQNLIFNKLIKSAKWASKEPVTEWSRSFLFSVVKTDFFNDQMSGFNKELVNLTVWNKETDSPVLIIITNAYKDHNYIINKYLEEININKKTTFLEERPKLTEFSGFTGTQDLFSHVHLFLKNYIISQYFGNHISESSINSIFSMIYKIGGTISLSENKLIFRMNIQENDPIFNDVKQVTQRINQREIMDYSGRVIKVHI